MSKIYAVLNINKKTHNIFKTTLWSSFKKAQNYINENIQGSNYYSTIIELDLNNINKEKTLKEKIDEIKEDYDIFLVLFRSWTNNHILDWKNRIKNAVLNAYSGKFLEMLPDVLFSISNPELLDFLEALLKYIDEDNNMTDKCFNMWFENDVIKTTISANIDFLKSFINKADLSTRYLENLFYLLLEDDNPDRCNIIFDELDIQQSVEKIHKEWSK